MPKLGQHLDALFVESVLIEVEDGGFDGAWWWKDGQANVDSVAAFRVQNYDLLPLPVRRRFLSNTKSLISVPTKPKLLDILRTSTGTHQKTHHAHHPVLRQCRLSR